MPTFFTQALQTFHTFVSKTKGNRTHKNLYKSTPKEKHTAQQSTNIRLFIIIIIIIIVIIR